METNKNEIEEIREEMKDVKTNLENMENIAGGNMISMEHQLKSELEKPVHECMEDRMKNIEDRMEKKVRRFEILMKNAATTDSAYVTSVPRTIQPQIYDGQTPWPSYKEQFEAAATANLWEEEQKSAALIIALRGAALEIL